MEPGRHTEGRIPRRFVAGTWGSKTGMFFIRRPKGLGPVGVSTRNSFRRRFVIRYVMEGAGENMMEFFESQEAASDTTPQFQPPFRRAADDF